MLATISGILPFFLFLFLSVELGLAGFLAVPLLFLVPVLILFIVAIRRKSGRVFAWPGLILVAGCSVFLLIYFFTFTPAGSVPSFLREYKFKNACPCDFWLEFDRANMKEVQSRYTIILCRFGTVHFESDPNTYNRQNVIEYAEQNGWIYKCSVILTEEDFKRYYDKRYEDWDSITEVIQSIGWYNYSPLWIDTDCELMAFDTGSGLGTASFILLSRDGAEMFVRYCDPLLPDGPHDFLLPPCFFEETTGTQWNNE